MVEVDVTVEAEIVIAVVVEMSVLWKLTRTGEETNQTKLDKDVEMESAVHSMWSWFWSWSWSLSLLTTWGAGIICLVCIQIV